MARRINSPKDPSPLAPSVDASAYLKAHRNIDGASTVFQPLTDLILKLVDSHKARAALQAKLASSDADARVKSLVEDALYSLAVTESRLYRAWELSEILRELDDDSKSGQDDAQL